MFQEFYIYAGTRCATRNSFHCGHYLVLLRTEVCILCIGCCRCGDLFEAVEFLFCSKASKASKAKREVVILINLIQKEGSSYGHYKEEFALMNGAFTATATDYK